jgi:hypothetical protein
VYAASNLASQKTCKIYEVNVANGTMKPFKTFGAEAGAGVSHVNAPFFSNDGSAYVYGYARVLSEAYVVKGLK